MTNLDRPHIAAALRDAEIEPDDRGLMSLADARSTLADATVFERDNADRVWAALLSLEGADELTHVSSRLSWRFHPRGRENLALVERYGEGLVPWLASRVSDGVLVNAPWCIGPSLLALSSSEVFTLLYDLRGYNDSADMQFWEAKEPEQLDEEALGRGAEQLLALWCKRHPAVALGELAKRADDEMRAANLLRRQAQTSPASTFARLTELLGDTEAEALATKLDLPRTLTPEAVLDHLDRAAEHIWPQFNYATDGRIEYFGMRLIACRARAGDGWGIVFERITGSYPDQLSVARMGYGSEVPLEDPNLGDDYKELVFEGDDPLFHGGRMIGPEGPEGPDGAGKTLELDESIFDEYDLRPGVCCEVGYWPYRVLLIRAYLAVHPDSFWSDPSEAAGLLGLDDPEILVVSDAFHHVIGPYGRQGVPEQRWEVAPSASQTYRSLSECIANRDGTLFEPGESNLDWRLHAHVEHDLPLPWTQRRVEPGDGERGHLEAALSEAGLAGDGDRDGRGLMPLERARAVVSAAAAFEKGRGEWVGEVYVQGSDRLWAALMSLSDGDELAREAPRLDWRIDPRGGPDNLAPAQRYGDALLPWLVAQVDEEGVLHNRPTCLRANLLAVGSREVVDLLLRLSGFSDPTASGSLGVELEALWDAWIALRPALAYGRLAELAREGDATAQRRLRQRALLDHEAVWAALGDDAQEVYELVGAPTDLAPEHVLAQLDRAAAGAATDSQSWPRFHYASYPGVGEYHGLRLAGLRSAAGWHVVLERLTGYGRDARLARYVYGAEGVGNVPELDQPIQLEFGESSLRCPAGEIDLQTTEPVPGSERMTERPDYWGAREAPGWNRALRTVLSRYPDAYWCDPEELIAKLELADAEVVVVATELQHACGPELPPESDEKPWHVAPSESPAYASLARLLTTGEGTFEPGEPNTDWSLHAVFEG